MCPQHDEQRLVESMAALTFSGDRGVLVNPQSNDQIGPVPLAALDQVTDTLIVSPSGPRGSRSAASNDSTCSAISARKTEPTWDQFSVGR